MNLESDIIRQRLISDPEYQELIQQVMKLHYKLTRNITTVSPPKTEYRQSYNTLVEKLAQNRGTALFYPYIGSGVGFGPYVLLEDGSVKLDFITGIGPNYWGHSPSDLIASSIEGLFLQDTVMQGNLQPTRMTCELIDLLIQLSGFDHCFISTSGAMAGENALKLLFQKSFPKQRVLAFDNSFAGRSLAMSQITDKALYRKNLPKLLQVDYIPFYNEQLGVEKSYQETMKYLNMHMRRFPDEHAMICAELIQGEGGFRVGNPLFFKKLFTTLKERGVLIWLDEVQTFGRTQELFASKLFEVLDMGDVMTIGKVSQVCATLFRKELKPLPGLISQTFTASSSAFSSALWGIKKSINEGHYGVTGKIERLSSYFTQSLERLSLETNGAISGPWGIGSMIAFTPFSGDEAKTIAFAKKLFDNGLIGFYCGSHPTKIRFLLPVGVLDESHIDEACAIIKMTLENL